MGVQNGIRVLGSAVLLCSIGVYFGDKPLDCKVFDIAF